MQPWSVSSPTHVELGMSFLRTVSLLAFVLVLGLAACQGDRPSSHPVGLSPAGGVTTPSTVPAPVASQPAAPPAVQAQIDRGVVLFAQNCASCHGARGAGTTKAPAVIGEGTLPENPPPGARLRTVRFESAMDLGMFIKNNMPYGGTHLPPRDVACVLAWLLQQHGRTPTQPISPATAGAIRR